jgi:HSP20 family protein
MIGNRYSVGCRPNEICGSSETDFLWTMPEIQAMLRRRRNKQRYFYRPFLDEFRTNIDVPFGTSTFPPWKTRINKRSTPTTASLRYDIIETDSNIHIAIDVPGIEMENISILLDDQTKVLTVSGSRVQSTTSRLESEERDESSDTSTSTSTRTFAQKFVLKNPTIDINQISASLENGVLTVTLPKIPPKESVQETNMRKIPITSTKTDITSAATMNENMIHDDGNQPTTVNDHEGNESESVVAMSETVEDAQPADDGTSDNSNGDQPDNNDLGKDTE